MSFHVGDECWNVCERLNGSSTAADVQVTASASNSDARLMGLSIKAKCTILTHVPMHMSASSACSFSGVLMLPGMQCEASCYVELDMNQAEPCMSGLVESVAYTWRIRHANES